MLIKTMLHFIRSERERYWRHRLEYLKSKIDSDTEEDSISSFAIVRYKNDSGNHKCYPILYKEKSECCGCTSCFNICPVSAIEMVEDEEGFFYPVIDTGKCIRCLKCITHCPI